MADKTETKVEKVTTEELDNLLGVPGADVAIMGDSEENEGKNKKPSFFDNKKPDMTFLNEENKTEEEEEIEEEEEDNNSDDPSKKKGEEEKGSLEDVLEEIDSEEDDKKKGRSKIDKGGMAKLTQALIDEKLILPFEGDDKPLEDYTVEEFKELFKLNIEEKEDAIRKQTPKDFFNMLPEELQYAAKYVADGGRDLKGLFKHLAASEETKSLSLESESGQEEVIRQYLRATNFGDDSEIQEEIDTWKDLGRLETKANQFKPKLDKMQEKIIEKKIKEQEANKVKQEEASKKYANSIYSVLEKGDLNGLKMSTKVQNMLYQGLVQPNYNASNGAPTNYFGHLIEKHQFIEPNHGLIAEALWLLADPDGYKKEISKNAKNKNAEETARKLKTEQANKVSSSAGEENDDTKRSGVKKGIKKPNKNFFQR